MICLPVENDSIYAPTRLALMSIGASNVTGIRLLPKDFMRNSQDFERRRFQLQLTSRPPGVWQTDTTGLLLKPLGYFLTRFTIV